LTAAPFLPYHWGVSPIATNKTQANLSVLISRGEIARRVGELAAQISKDYQDRPLVLVGVLKGAFVFLSDLARAMDTPVEMDFVRLASYGHDTNSSGKVRVLQRLHSSVKGKDVLIVEDIVDTGLTTSWLVDYLKKKGPASVKLCALLDKVERRKVSVAVDYRGFVVPNKFVVGYGTDWDEKFRHLPDICVLENTNGH